MKRSTMLLLGGLGVAALYALSKREETPEGGETTEPDRPEATFEPHPEGQQWDPSPEIQPGTQPVRFDISGG